VLGFSEVGNQALFVGHCNHLFCSHLLRSIDGIESLTPISNRPAEWLHGLEESFAEQVNAQAVMTTNATASALHGKVGRHGVENDGKNSTT
jgi:hypothetical protein